jgi:hypothetical protein
MSKLAHRRKWAISAAGLLLPAGLIASVDHFAIDRWTVDGGGAMDSTGGDFELSGTIGQPDAHTMNGGEFELFGGFWFPLAPSDCNEEGTVDLVDYADFEPCIAGPGAGTPAGCECFDVNRNDTVDLLDFAVIQTVFTGS